MLRAASSKPGITGFGRAGRGSAGCSRAICISRSWRCFSRRTRCSRTVCRAAHAWRARRERELAVLVGERPRPTRAPPRPGTPRPARPRTQRHDQPHARGSQRVAHGARRQLLRRTSGAAAPEAPAPRRRPRSASRPRPRAARARVPGRGRRRLARYTAQRDDMSWPISAADEHVQDGVVVEAGHQLAADVEEAVELEHLHRQALVQLPQLAGS